MSVPLFLMIPGAPTPVAPFSHAVEVDGWVLITGQMPTWPDDDGRELPVGVEAQTARVMDNLKLVLAGMNLDLSNVVQARVYLTEFKADYARMMRSMRRTFQPSGGRHARVSA